MKKALFYYCLILTIFITLGAASAVMVNMLSFLLFLPVTLYFVFTSLKYPQSRLLVTILLYCSFIVTAIMSLIGLIGARNVSQLISAAIFLPMTVYFILRVMPGRQVLRVPLVVSKPEQLTQRSPKLDVNRRQFLKAASSAGFALFLFSIFAKRAEAAFFGSVPGPGTVAIKDRSGTQIDPAIKTPTDGYKINQLDDSSPAYYGFVNKDGDWFIMKEDSDTGDYRYYKKKTGDSDFSTEWPNRATLSPYGYFDAIFGAS